MIVRQAIDQAAAQIGTVGEDVARVGERAGEGMGRDRPAGLDRGGEMKRVSNWRGTRLVSRKLRSSWRTIRDKIRDNMLRTVIFL